MHTRLKSCRLSPAESHDDDQLLFAICSSGTKELHPHIKKILARLRLTQMVIGVFLKTTEVNLKMLASVVPFVTYRGEDGPAVFALLVSMPSTVDELHAESLRCYGESNLQMIFLEDPRRLYAPVISHCGKKNLQVSNFREMWIGHAKKFCFALDLLCGYVHVLI
ncbi:hypothetical protein BRADI_2g08815v3 [Brachypodium distachyon]|uniref:Uncharacterized protein n=1 Tax=Brachypodium distachyon TaxID=15368 RepID=A0A0Q3FW30_BRADI|nr:hypothetical protein BRADI_2g08815v3 [Brachypodium distachyon]